MLIFTRNHKATILTEASMTLDLADIQGLVAFGYSRLRFSSFEFLHIKNRHETKRWLKTLPIEDARSREEKAKADVPVSSTALNVAIGAPGLVKLGISRCELYANFPPEFCGTDDEGAPKNSMGEAIRANVLGDVGTNDPHHWEYGNPKQPTLDLVVLLYAKDETELENLRARWITPAIDSGAVSQIASEKSRIFEDEREHFGFRDGLSQPDIDGIGGATKPSAINPGEFLLGCPDEYGTYSYSPTVNGGHFDFGKFGSYLVIRKLRQDVAGFHHYFQKEAASHGGSVTAGWLAAKCVGRWPSGAPLVRYPQTDPGMEGDNNFEYVGDGKQPIDSDGLKCPIAAHIRRSNPRDSLDEGSVQSRVTVRRHRLLRRGRTFGERPVDPAIDDGKSRGLFFITLQASIRKQFEFVQQTWLNDGKFSRLYESPDPITAPKVSAEIPPSMTIPQDPVRLRLSGMPQFVTTLGGGYFFLPSLSAMQYLCELPDK
ncbi:Dyp-type peroxidase [Zavarzinella formosa]|uniref:Dyp-type peroxidase n=1 Tax=Zavarzinella formosa TaxID=360055 RepID=UPI00030336FA|nr:Dyp-type peroxidase [Zavarzinella formosa]